MKKTVSLFLSFIMIISAVCCVDFSAFAATINSKEINLYYLTDSYAEKISIPNNYNKSFQLKVSGASSVSYSVLSGDTATVSSSGLVQPKGTTWYWYGSMGSTFPMPGYGDPTRVEIDYEEGDTVIQVRADKQTFNVNVHVYDYSVVYADNVMDDYIKNNVKAGMTDYEKVVLCAKFTASYDYSASYSSAASMIIFGGGDCWASTDSVIKMAEKFGFDAWQRNGNRDPGAGSGHMNAMVQVTDGTYYEVEAGYSNPSPRPYNVKKRTSLFSTFYNSYSDDGVYVYQYDGKTMPASLVVPDTFDGVPATEIGAKFIQLNDSVKQVQLPDTVKIIGDSAFNSCKNLESINIPASLETLGNFVFTGCNKLINIKSSSPNFPASDGMIYNKDKSVLLYAPAVNSINIPASVKTIKQYAFYHNYSIKNAVVPNTVKVLEEGAFGNCENLESVTLFNGSLTDIGCFAFACCYKLERIVAPKSVSLIDENAFYNCSKLKQVTVLNKNCTIGDSEYTFPENTVLYGFTGSTLEAYAKKYSREFVSLDNCKHTSTTEIVTKEPTCIAEGSKDIRCNICDSVVKNNISIPKTAHTEVIDVKAVEATCIAEGKTKASHCSVCNQVISVSKTVPVKDHTYTAQSVIDPTCTEKGYTIFVCSSCGDSYVDEIPAKGHTPVTDKAVAPTCLKVGLTEGSHCSKCNEILVKQTEVAKIPHSYKWQNVNGMIAKKCINCPEIASKLPFVDLGNCALYGDYVEYTSVLNQFITGTNPPARTLFSPATPITRAMFVTILYRMAGEPYKNSNPYDASPFTDITDTSVYYYDAACWALDNNITTQTTFKPYDNVSREQTASFLFRYAKENNMLGDDAYKNVNLSVYHDYDNIRDWSKEAMQWANYNGMITGTQQGYANPQGSTLRIHATKILYGFGKTCNIGNFE